jgi:hypothetical protein
VPVEGEAFFHLASLRLVDRPCEGTACFVAAIEALTELAPGPHPQGL